MALNSILKNQRPSLVFGLPLVIQRRDRDKTNRGHQPVASPEMNIANRQLTVMAEQKPGHNSRRYAMQTR